MFFSRFFFISFFKNCSCFRLERGMSVIYSTSCWCCMLLLRLSLLNYDDDCLLSVLNVVSYFQKHQNKQWMDDIFVKWWRRPQKVYDFSTATMSRNRSWANGLCCRIDANGFCIESQSRFSFEMQYFFSTQYGQILILSFVVNASSCDAYYCTYLHRHASQRITHKKKTSFVWFRTKRMATFKRQKTPTQHIIEQQHKTLFFSDSLALSSSSD